MTQTYPKPLPVGSWNKAQDGTPCTNPAATYATAATSTPAYTPAVYNTDKPANHPAGDPDFVLVTLVAKSHNMPY